LDLHAAADFLGPGAIEINRYQTRLRISCGDVEHSGSGSKQVPATGHPSRFFEQTGIPALTAAQAFVDPRNIVALVANPTRVERSVPLKALVSQINYNLFDMEVGSQQSQFAFLQGQRIWRTRSKGCCVRMIRRCGTENDTSLATPTTQQYSLERLDRLSRVVTRPRSPVPPAGTPWTGSRE